MLPPCWWDRISQPPASCRCLPHPCSPGFQHSCSSPHQISSIQAGRLQRRISIREWVWHSSMDSPLSIIQYSTLSKNWTHIYVTSRYVRFSCRDISVLGPLVKDEDDLGQVSSVFSFFVLDLFLSLLCFHFEGLIYTLFYISVLILISTVASSCYDIIRCKQLFS